MTGFITTTKNSKKNVFKKALPFVGIAFLAISVFLLLWLPATIGAGVECKRIEEQTGIERCESKFKKVIFVVGDTANTPNPAIDGDYSDLITSMYGGDKRGFYYISVSEPDVAPKRITIDSLKNAKEEIVDKLSQSKAEVNGADYLEAIRMAAYYSDKKDDTLIYVIGSGLSDSGLLNFAGDSLLTKYSTNEITESFKKTVSDKNELRGLTIVWQGMGETVKPQSSLSTTFRDKEKRIYESILTSLGIDKSDIHFSSDSITGKNNVETTVKVTSLKDAITIIFSNDDSSLAFAPNEATFIDPGSAKSEIQKFVADHPDSQFIIKSYMSRGMCDNGIDEGLLEGRSMATKNLLKQVGVSSSDIEIEKGELGDSKECPNGLIHEPAVTELAKQNRKVVIKVVRK